MTVLLEIELRVNDVDGLLDAARRQLMEDGWPEAAADKLLHVDGVPSETCCVVALLAPGRPPTPALSILNVTARKMQ